MDKREIELEQRPKLKLSARRARATCLWRAHTDSRGRANKQVQLLLSWSRRQCCVTVIMGYNPPTTTPSKKAPAKKSKPALPKPTPRKRTTTKENANPTATRTPIAAKVRTIDNDQGSRPEDEMDIDGPTNPEEALVDLDDNSLEKMKG